MLEKPQINLWKMLVILFGCLMAALFLFFAVGAVSVVLHEVIHFLTALAMEVPADEITLVWNELGPGLALPWVYLARWPLLLYSGGLFSGAVLIVAYIISCLYSYRKEPSTMVMGFLRLMLFSLLAWGLLHLYFGYYEGRYYPEYSSGSIDPTTPVLIMLIFSAVFHLALTIYMDKKSDARHIAGGATSEDKVKKNR